jgi:hypothetical protein
VNQKPGNTRAFGLTLPDDVAAWVEQAARRTGKTAECLLEELVIKSLEEETIPLELRLQRLDGLIKKMLILTKKTPMKEEKDAKGHIHSLEERTKRRENLIELGMKAYEELMKIAADERTSKEAKARLQAFSVMARVGLFNAAVIRDAEDDEIAEFLSELEETDNKMKEELKRLEEKRREEEHDERRY